MRYRAPKAYNISNLKPRNSKEDNVRTVFKGEVWAPKIIYISNLKPWNSKDGRTVSNGEALVPKAYIYIYLN